MLPSASVAVAVTLAPPGVPAQLKLPVPSAVVKPSYTFPSSAGSEKISTRQLGQAVPETEAVTTNLMAPIVINTKTRRGRQVIVEGDRYLTKHLIGGEIKDGFDAGIDAESW